jgi:hypothetical protein
MEKKKQIYLGPSVEADLTNSAKKYEINNCLPVNSIF